jgi:hypothetical protein
MKGSTLTFDKGRLPLPELLDLTLKLSEKFLYLFSGKNFY